MRIIRAAFSVVFQNILEAELQIPYTFRLSDAESQWSLHVVSVLSNRKTDILRDRKHHLQGSGVRYFSYGHEFGACVLSQADIRCK